MSHKDIKRVEKKISKTKKMPLDDETHEPGKEK
jgi:hypothetical protein